MTGRRKLGALEVSAIGLGCMSMTPIYGVPDADEAIATVHRAPELGIDLIDTSDAYGANGANEELSVARSKAGGINMSSRPSSGTFVFLMASRGPKAIRNT